MNTYMTEVTSQGDKEFFNEGTEKIKKNNKREILRTSKLSFLWAQDESIPWVTEGGLNMFSSFSWSIHLVQFSWTHMDVSKKVSDTSGIHSINKVEAGSPMSSNNTLHQMQCHCLTTQSVSLKCEMEVFHENGFITPVWQSARPAKINQQTS